MRQLDFAVELAGSPDEVWERLTEGEGITRWFAPEAKVEPGLGGTVLLSWGPGMEGKAPITAWEPGKRFQWTESSGRVITFFLEARDGGTTQLRLVHSGFGAEASFDAEYDSTNYGWHSFLALLAWDLAAHRAKAAKHVFRMRMADQDRNQWRDALLQAMTFERDEDGFRARLANGVTIRGNVLFDRAPGYLILTDDRLGALALFLEPCGGQTAFTSSWYLRGAGVDQATEIAEGWDQTLQALA